MYYAIVAWHGLGEFKSETFTQIIRGGTFKAAGLNARVWARTHLDKAVRYEIAVTTNLEHAR